MLSGLQFPASSPSTVAHARTQTGWQGESHGNTWEHSIKTRPHGFEQPFPILHRTEQRRPSIRRGKQAGRGSKNLKQTPAFTFTSVLRLDVIGDESSLELQAISDHFALVEKSHNPNDGKSSSIKTT